MAITGRELAQQLAGAFSLESDDYEALRDQRTGLEGAELVRPFPLLRAVYRAVLRPLMHYADHLTVPPTVQVASLLSRDPEDLIKDVVRPSFFSLDLSFAPLTLSRPFIPSS